MDKNSDIKRDCFVKIDRIRYETIFIIATT